MENQENKIDFFPTLERLYEHDNVALRRVPRKFSFGKTKEECENLFYQAFRAVDLSVDKVEKLPEYSEVIDWMSDNKGKGLLLIGDCGRGKSVIACGVLPLLFAHIGNVTIRPIPANRLSENLEGMIHIGKWCFGHIVDDIGTENVVNEYGVKREPFIELVSAVEDRIQLLIVTTNLDREQMTDRYGVRIIDRLVRLCKTIEFKGDSLRK